MDNSLYQQRQGILRKNRGQKSTPISIPAPVKGWNTIASLADMDPQEASTISNWLPGLGYVRLRKGYQKYAQSIGTGDVSTLTEYWAGSVHKLLAASSTNIYDTAGNVATYAPNAVTFDGTNDYLLRGAALTGLTDGKAGSVSFWIRLDGNDGATQTIFEIQDSAGGNSGLLIQRINTNVFKIQGNNSTPGIILDLRSTSTYTTNTKWYNVLASWDLNAGTTNLYVNNVSDKNQITATNDTIDYTKTDASFGATTLGNQKITASISEFWWTNTYIDFSSAPNRAKFIDSNGYPVSLGATGSVPTGTAPIIYLNGAAASFQTNAGTGGNFTVTGSLTNASTTPATAGLSLGSGYTNGRWQTANFVGNLFFANGFDTPQVYNGTAISNWTGTGPTVANVIGCNVYRNRLWVWEKNAQKVWYSATDTIGGAYTAFNIYDVGRFGGNLIGCATFTHDGGNGPDDYICFVLSSGDVLVYSGDPASTFSIVGVFHTGQPLDVRGVIKVGGDVMIATVEDYVLLSQILSANYIPSKISGDVKTVSASYASNTGWQAIQWSKGSLILVNIPTSSTTFDQHVLNTVTGAWTKYTNIPSRCWAVYNGDLYFGGTGGVVYKAESALDDDGTSISADCTQAYTSLGGTTKNLIRAYRPLIQAEGALNYTSGIAYDFNPVPVTQITNSVTSGPFWDQTLWDTSQWAGSSILIQDWHTGFGRGYQAAVRVRITTMDQNIYWYRTDYLVEQGGPI